MSWHRVIVAAIALLLIIALATAVAIRRGPASDEGAMAWARSTAADLVRLPGRLRRVAADPRTPRLARWLLAALALYIVSPIDLIPDFIPILGQADDLVVIAIVLATVHRMIPEEVWADHFPPPPADAPRQEH